jgi:hypothetical protein
MNQPNGHPGYGFKLRGPKGNRTKVPDPHEQQVMRWIVEQRQAGWTWQTRRTHTGRPRVVGVPHSTGLSCRGRREDARANPQTTE